MTQVPEEPRRCSSWILRSRTSSASCRCASSCCAPWVRTKVSGSWPSGSVTTRTETLRRSSSPASAERRAETSPIVIVDHERLLRVPRDQLGLLRGQRRTERRHDAVEPAAMSRTTSKYPSTTITRSSRRIANLAQFKPYSRRRFAKIEDSGELTYLTCPGPIRRPPNPTVCPPASKIGNMSRPRKRGRGSRPSSGGDKRPASVSRTSSKPSCLEVAACEADR